MPRISLSTLLKCLVAVAVIALTAYISTLTLNPQGKVEETTGVGWVEEVRILIVYDNTLFNRSLKASWGFACVVELDNESILFDTGGDPETLLSNMAKMGVDTSKITRVVLSHIHGDHTGGLFGFLELRGGVTIYVPSSFPRSFKDLAESYGCKVVEISGPTVIREGVASTGEMGTWIKEQALIVNTSRGAIVITGCAHPGVVNMVERAKEIAGDVYMVLGGFHLAGASRSEVVKIAQQLDELGVKLVAPCHCTGENAKAVFRELYGERFVEIGVGAVLEVKP